MKRREVLKLSLASASAALGGGLVAAPSVTRAAESRWTLAVPVVAFAPGDGKPAGEALQAALDAALKTGLPLVFPRGEWVVDKPLAIRHTDRRRRGFPRIVGAGVGSTMRRTWLRRSNAVDLWRTRGTVARNIFSLWRRN